ncbi:NADPH-dependent FMN reductase [Actinomadura flavalba]|uniref:NADPH-dependent FMN reductase n=1 Tax=Actinomadura flavalba TaxID=1120938 RepID=UPI00036312A3|nr:NAD(P)H-dependent oxidoreductase [Actinomadura flavalba]
MTAATVQAPPIRVAVIIGSTRQGRFGPTVARWFTRRAAERDDVVLDVVDTAEAVMPHTFGTAADDAGFAAATAKLAAADAFVVVTPEYNHSYPGTLKNLIDQHGAEWHAKPVAFVSYGGLSGGLRAVEHLRPVFAELHAVTIRDTVSLHQPWSLFDDSGELVDGQRAIAAAKTLLDQLTWWGAALRDARAARPYGA